MAAVVAPVLHLYVVPADEVKVTVVPGHKFVVVAGDDVMVGVAGAAFTTVVTAGEVPLQPKLSVTVTLNVPATESMKGLVATPLPQAYLR